MLVFLLPILLVYEVGSVLYLHHADGVTETVGAWHLLISFFEIFGAAGLHLPGATLLVVLLVWHALRRDPNRVDPTTLAGMAAESVAWTLPLLVLGVMLSPARAAVEPAALAQAGGIHELSWQARLTLSLGAGLYEELLFRMVGIAAIHMLLADLLRTPDRWAGPLAVVVSAIAFAWYHDAAGSSDEVRRLMLFYLLSGLYFGAIYLTRGFGIVVAAHALYDVCALVLLTG